MSLHFERKAGSQSICASNGLFVIYSLKKRHKEMLICYFPKFFKFKAMFYKIIRVF